MRKALIFAGVVLGLLLGGDAFAQKAGEEILYPGEAFAKLDTFEALNLQDADKLYGKGDYSGAYAAYKAYSFEFTKSQAMPYVLLRMGRCLHLSGKRNAAIKAYQDVVDYFPDDVRYSAGALYYIGECHGQNGDIDRQTAVWARMVKDDDYVAQPNSGTALIHLAGAMDRLEKHDEAVEYRWRTAVAFARSNERAAADARNAVMHHYVVRKPNHEKLKEFYTACGGFDGRGHKVEQPEDDGRYWSDVLSAAQRAGGEAADRERVCSYWSAKMGDRFKDDDGLRLQWFDVLKVHEKDQAKWLVRMDQQFNQKPATLGRVLHWCEQFRSRDRGDLKTRSDFFAKYGAAFAKGMKFKDLLGLMEGLRRLEMDTESQALMRSASMQGMSDQDLREFGMFAANYMGEDDVLRYFAKIQDKLFAGKARFDYYLPRSHRNRPFQEKALAEIPELKKDPKYAGPGLVWTEADLLRGLGRYEEAIKAYNAANKQPDSTWAVTDCLVALKNYAGAIQNVQGLESVKETAPAACLKIADIYRVAGDKGKEVDQLRLVLRRYPKSGQSSQAHQRLEAYGVKIIGGLAEAE